MRFYDIPTGVIMFVERKEIKKNNLIYAQWQVEWDYAIESIRKLNNGASESQAIYKLTNRR